jgi:hypothetical protein
VHVSAPGSSTRVTGLPLDGGRRLSTAGPIRDGGGGEGGRGEGVRVDELRVKGYTIETGEEEGEEHNSIGRVIVGLGIGGVSPQKLRVHAPEVTP